MNPIEVVLQFLERINQHDADKLAELMTEGHVFIDSLGQSVRGREKMRTGWQSYFAFCPGYWVTHEEIFSMTTLSRCSARRAGRLRRMESFRKRISGERHRRGWRRWKAS
jgi:ketosteroid isomerase-like protein